MEKKEYNPIKLRGTKYANGMTVKSLKNTSVSLMVNDESKDEEVIIEFLRAGLSKDELEKQFYRNGLIRGKVKVTGFKITIQSALALYVCLDDYFKRIRLNK